MYQLFLTKELLRINLTESKCESVRVLNDCSHTLTLSHLFKLFSLMAASWLALDFPDSTMPVEIHWYK